MARTNTQIETEIEELEKLLSSGAESLTIDGTTTRYRSVSDINDRIAQLKQELQSRNGEPQTTIYRNVSLANGGAL